MGPRLGAVARVNAKVRARARVRVRLRLRLLQCLRLRQWRGTQRALLQLRYPLLQRPLPPLCLYHRLGRSEEIRAEIEEIRAQAELAEVGVEIGALVQGDGWRWG